MGLGIRVVLIATFLIASGAPLALLWFWPHSASLQNQVDEVRERHLLLAENLGAALSTYHNDLVAVFGAFAPKIARGDAEEAYPLFSNLHFRHVCVIDPASGVVTRAYFASDYKCPVQVPSERLALFSNLASGDEVTLSGVFAPDGEEPRIYLIKRLDDALVVGAIKTTFFQQLQKRISFGRRGHAAIVDGNGHVLAHPLQEWVQKAADISKVSAVQRILAGESGVQTFYSPALKGDMIAGFTAVDGTGWGVMVPQPLEELEETANRINRHAFAILAGGLMLTTLIALWISSKAAQRIKRLESAAVRVAEGADGVCLEGDRSRFYVRELTNLEDAFNRMASQIDAARAKDVARAADLETANQTLRSEIAERKSAEAERKSVEAALKTSEARFRNLFESEPIAIREEDYSQVKAEIDSVLGVDDDEAFSAFLDRTPAFVQECADKIIVVDANLAAVRLHGVDSKKELLKKVTKNLNNEALKVLKSILIAIHRGNTLLEFETNVKTPKGLDRIIMARWSVATGYEKTYSRVLLTSIDITERRLAEERLKQAQKMEAVGQLTGGVAHDFNNLLAVIGGNAELLADDPRVNASLTDSIKLAVRRGSELTQRLLAFSRLQPLRPRAINLVNVVTDMSELLGRTLGETIQLKTKMPPELWDALADPGQVENAILNLAINARDAMPNGGRLTIECANARLDEARMVGVSEDVTGEFVVLAVSDDGVGMSARVLAHAFEPFFTTKEVGKGSGLGLSMVYGFAKQSGGHVTVYSEEGKGTTVRLYLPRSVDAEQAKPLPLLDGEIPRGRGEKVLVIEDDAEVRVLAVQILQNLGYKVVDVPDAASARKALAEQEAIDIVLSDVVLPGEMSGLEFADEARAAQPGLRVIFMSGYAAEAAVQNGSLAPDNVLLNKPFERRQLATVLREQLDANAA